MTGAGGRGVIVAGTHSGCGKTTVTLGILAALRKESLAVQPFKAGPDFIDAGLHRLVTGRPSRNLDLWMCGNEFVAACFARHAAAADISIIEGVMGLYDGDQSTASLARLLQVPVILVIDGYGMAESAGAVVRGFAEFGVQSSEFGGTKDNSQLPTHNSELNIAGVIFNRVASENHFARLKDSVRDVPVLGYLPRDIDYEIPHRHLGLTVAEEGPLEGAKVELLADSVLKHVDVDRIVRIAADGVDPRAFYPSGQAPRQKKRFNVALAYDKAFCFYYEDNLDLLRDAGAEVTRFSPLAGPAIPNDADAVYIGGGYPELHAGELSRNTAMLRSISDWAQAGKPLYAECGGLMYLSKGIRDFGHTLYPMAGVFPFETRMTKKPRLGYREIVLSDDCILGQKGDRCRGHEFHYSEIADEKQPKDGGQRLSDKSPQTKIYSLRDKNGLVVADEGFRFRNTLASYVHVHFGSNPHVAERFAAFVKEGRCPVDYEPHKDYMRPNVIPE